MLSLRSVPWNGDPLQHLDEIEECHGQCGQHHQRGKQQCRIKVARGLDEHVAKAFVRADKLARQRADDGQRRCNFESAEDGR